MNHGFSLPHQCDGFKYRFPPRMNPYKRLICYFCDFCAHSFWLIAIACFSLFIEVTAFVCEPLLTFSRAAFISI